MITADTSVVVAAFASWHDQHEIADRRIGSGSRLIAHVAAETLATLTRMPDPFRVEAQPVWEFLEARFDTAWLAPTARQTKALLSRAVERGVSGGAVYDALIAGAASAGGATLLSLDRRAARIYRDLDASFELLA